MAVDEDAVDEALEDALEGPKRASGDQGSFETHSIEELRRLRKDVAAETGAVNGRVFLAQFRMRPPGAV